MKRLTPDSAEKGDGHDVQKAQDLKVSAVVRSTLEAEECDCGQCQNYARDVHWLIGRLKKAQERIAKLEKHKK